MAEVGRGTVLENGSDECVSGWDWLYGWDRAVVVGMVYCGRILPTVCWRKDHLAYFVINCVFVPRVERHVLRLNQSTSLISKLFCKAITNSISQRSTR